MMHRMTVVLGVLLCTSAALTPRASHADQPPESGSIRIHVKGSSHVQASAQTDPRAIIVRGELIDDAGAPIAGGVVTIRTFSAAAPETPLTLPEPLPCSDGRARGPHPTRAPSRDEYVVTTDERGSFCVRGDDRLPQAATVRVRFRGTPLHDGAEARVALDAAASRVARALLRFEPAVEAIDLDRESVPITASLRVERTEFSAEGAAKREGLTVALDDERGTTVAEAVTGGDGRARFNVRTASLGPPGQGELRLRFEGTPELAKAAATMPVVRHADVRLALTHPLESADPEDGASIDVDVTSSRGPVSGGVVEALRGAENVGAGAVEAGKTRVIVSFAVDRAGSVPLTLRYVPAAPWWRAGPALRVDLPIAGPGILRRVLLAFVVVVVTAWVIAGWRRAPKPRARAEGEAAAAPPSGRAGVQVVATSGGQSGWRGIVTDAHDGTPVKGARLAIIVPAFEGDGVATRATTDERGSFTLDGVPLSGAARLVVDSATHSTYEQTLPPPSVLAVALVTRRRAVLERLVRWARRQGLPYDGPPEPTPGHVRRAASRTNAPEVEAWAQKVEHLAFGPEAVDERMEQQARSLEPKGGGAQ